MIINFSKASIPPSTIILIILFFISSWWKIASAARNWINSVPKQQRRPLPSRLYLSFFIWQHTCPSRPATAITVLLRCRSGRRGGRWWGCCWPDKPPWPSQCRPGGQADQSDQADKMQSAGQGTWQSTRGRGRGDGSHSAGSAATAPSQRRQATVWYWEPAPHPGLDGGRSQGPAGWAAQR